MRRILLDQGLPATAAPVMRDAGWDAIHVREIGMAAAEDPEILAYAVREVRVVVTLDRDFPQLLALAGAMRPSVVLIRRQRLRTPDLLPLLAAVWNDHETALNQGCVVRVSARGTRLRLLPLK